MFFDVSILKGPKPQDVVSQKYLTTICCMGYILLQYRVDVSMLIGLQDIVAQKYRTTTCSFQILTKVVHKKLSTTAESQ